MEPVLFRVRDEVNVKAVQRNTILRQLVQCRLFAPPIVAMPPVLGKRAQVNEVRTLLPACVLKLIWPARRIEPMPQVSKHCVWNLD